MWYGKITSILLLTAVFICLGCVEAPDTDSGDVVRIVVTIPPQAEFVERIGGDKVMVTVMVPPGASPHIYDPTPSQLVEVGKADMYVLVGSGVEFEEVWFNKIRETNRDMAVVNCSQGIKLMNGDPHIWLSPRNAGVMVENIYQELIQVDPENRGYYTANKDKYLQELKALDKEIAGALSGTVNKRIMVYHPAWGYFVREYGFEQISIEREGKEPTPQGVADLINQARDNNITLIFASPQFSTKSAEVIASETGGRVVLVDPLARDYIDNLRTVSESLSNK